MRFILALLIVIYTTIFSWLCYAQFRSLENHYPQDMAAHSQECWNTSHGRFLQQTVHYFGGPDHFYLILALFAPIYGIANNICVLFFLYSLIAASGAIPVYLLARDRLGSRYWGLLMAILYLVYPGLHYLNLFDLKPVVLSLPLLIFAFYFWQAKNLKGFLVSALLASLVTELVAFPIMMFSALSWIEKRDKRWIHLPLFIGVTLLVVAHLFFVPLISGNFAEDIGHNKYFRYINLFAWDSYKHIFDLLGIASIFLITSWEAFILSIPYLTLGVFTKTIHTHYYFPLSFILFITLIFAINKIMKLRMLKNISFLSEKLMVITIVALISFFTFDPFLIRPRYNYPMSVNAHDAWFLIQQIPHQASVTCDPVLLPALSRRERLHEFSRKEYYGKEINYLDVEYILIDPRGPHRKSGRHKDYLGNVQRLIEQTQLGNSGFEIVATRGDWILFHRNGKTLRNL